MEERNEDMMLFHLYQSNIAALLDFYKQENASKEIIKFMEDCTLKAGNRLALKLDLMKDIVHPDEAKGRDSLI